MERKWIIRPSVDVPPGLLDHLHQNRTVASYLIRRGITTPEAADHYLIPSRDILTDPNQLPDMTKAANRVVKAINTKEKIGIWGDFDVDGQTSTAILVECLRKLGTNTVFYLPDRRIESHGINITSLQQFLQQDIQLLITCDTGIAEFKAIEYATQSGVDVIVTDHHTLPEVLPPALACVNPRRVPENHPLGSLSGSGAAFELMLAVCRLMGKEDIAVESIDLAAIGLIADIAPLIGDSRLLAQLGLIRLKEEPRHCIRVLAESTNSAGQSMDEQFIGYTIAPRLNAVGRLENANPIVEFLMDSLPQSEMKDLVERIETINANRKWLCDQVYQAAHDQLLRQKDTAIQPVIMLSHPTWTGGVLGLAAGKLARDFNRPAIVLTETPTGLMKGSARSVEGVNITEAISSASEFLLGYGGHPMAAGLSFRSNLTDNVRQSINKSILDQGFRPERTPEMEIDSELSLSDIKIGFYEEIEQLAPFGNQNPPLVFCSKSLSISSLKPLGRDRDHFQLLVEDEAGHSIPAKWWNAEESRIPEGKFDFAYSLNLNTYKGITTLEAVWIDSHPIQEPEIIISVPDTVRIIDLRGNPAGESPSINTYTQQPYIIFQEPLTKDDPYSSGRNGIRRVKTLIMESIPPEQQVLTEILSKSRPEKIIVLFHYRGKLSIEAFLNRLAGHIKYAVVNREGLASLKDLAQAMNSTENVVRTGLEWFVADGKVLIRSNENDLYRLEIKQEPGEKEKKEKLSEMLRYQLDEISSFQKYLAELPVELLNNLL